MVTTFFGLILMLKKELILAMTFSSQKKRPLKSQPRKNQNLRKSLLKKSTSKNRQQKKRNPLK